MTPFWIEFSGVNLTGTGNDYGRNFVMKGTLNLQTDNIVLFKEYDDQHQHQELK